MRERLLRRWRIHRQDERGAVLILVALSLVVLMGMAAFAVDYGWLYFNQLNARKAAESAALAGVAHMPLPDCADPISGTVPFTSAIEIATSNGYSSSNGDSVSPVMGSTCARMKVTVGRTIPTFFMNVFGVSELSISEAATAEHLPILKLGSDDPFLGEDPEGDSARNVNFWLAMNGDRTPKGQGDAYTSERLGDYNWNAGLSNPEFNQADPPDIPPGAASYWYAIDVPAAHRDDPLQVQIYDPQTNPSANPKTDDRNMSSPISSTAYENSETRFRLYPPDATPNVWRDNAIVPSICSKTYSHEDKGAPSFTAADADTWVTFCPIASAVEGVYVLEVEQTGDVDILNAFSLRALVNGAPNNGVSVYGLGAMSLWMHEAGSNARFNAVKLSPVYADSRLVVQLWDVGDIDGTGSIEFQGSLATISCEVRERNHEGGVTKGWSVNADGTTNQDGSGHCKETIAPEREHNNEWVDFAFDIPGDFDCTGDACWATIQYNLPGKPHDRTTWSAFIDGQPIHLIP